MTPRIGADAGRELESAFDPKRTLVVRITLIETQGSDANIRLKSMAIERNRLHEIPSPKAACAAVARDRLAFARQHR